MELKEFLLEGGHISFPYKENRKEWLETSRLHIFSGDYSLPKVHVDTTMELKTFPLEELDVAIDYYINEVLNEKNLWYKMSPTLREFNLRKDFFDLEEDDDYNRFNKLRLTKIKLRNGK